ncbi:MAG: 16S rRNA (cytidine(1402)-2'-O)-methyltransferase, partial [Bacillota bacterium]|nr:16S rRNA (cytidine(1402)-2'-O)-methyltransferase [Bacillota bacterium]
MSGGGGALYLVGTPIGNLEDITLRALKVLREVDLVAAEDTRRSRQLLSHFGIRTRLVSYHEHNKKTRGPQLLAELRAGRRVALVTDAGMPGISDPGFELVRDAAEAAIPVVAVPGPSAFLLALAASGLPTRRFVFEGFLPRAAAERRRCLERLAAEERTVVFYEAPHRLPATLKDLADLAGDRPLVVARELTKCFEEIQRGTARELAARLLSREPRGEYVLVLGGRAAKGQPGAGEEEKDRPAGVAPPPPEVLAEEV